MVMMDLLRLLSGTLQTLPHLSADDIQCIWAKVSGYIERQMTLQKGVHLAGLGTFTFSQQKSDKYTTIQQPIFLLAGRLIQSFGLKQVRPLAAATKLPVVQLNFAAVSQETPFSRDVVEGCVRETFLLLFKALASGQDIFLTLQGIGVLSFKNNQVRMKFSRGFISAMDGTGRPLLASNSRPGSSGFLLSGGPSRLQGPQTANPVRLPTVCSPQPDNKAGDKDVWCLSPAPDQRNAGEVPQQREPKSHQPLQPAQMKAVCLSEELKPKPPPQTKYKPSTSVTPPGLTPKRLTLSCSGHTRAGQELCYLCMQRAQRNVPVYLRELQRAEERAQEKLLLLKAQQRDKHHMDQEQETLNEQRKHAKHVATFNLQMSEKKEKICCPLFPTSFVFPTRPFTPAKRIQQHRYKNDLQSQIETRRQREARDQQNRLLVEHLDQVQLVREDALQKAQQLQQKHERTAQYKRALDTQAGDKKCTDPPECQADDGGFNRCQTAANRAEGHERAQKLFVVNFSAATHLKKEELQSRLAELEREREVLKHNKMEFAKDRINRFEKERDISKSLEAEWSRTAGLKHQREEEERRFLRSAGELLVDKLAQYRRCCQCKRRTTNCGETNIWKDSRYLSGSQFMM
ncbi:coiled-coil domain-containing protein 81-like [Pungitius pungitius]|uniref:coiled-coil domain-containing protein 81-like n=1 Tax=Pungitius pungitius TaxID=134920 RepID=UPI002E0EBA0E